MGCRVVLFLFDDLNSIFQNYKGDKNMNSSKKQLIQKMNYDSLQHSLWTSHDEEVFLDGLGGHTKGSLPRPVLLNKYISFMENTRVSFGRLNKESLINYAKEAIVKNEPPKVPKKL
jgi:hypothetical protein